MERIDLPSGGWAELRDPKTLRAKDKRRVLKNIKGTPDEENPVAASLDTTDGMVCMMVTAWEIPYMPDAALPGDAPEMLDELEIPDYDVLLEAVTPARELLFPDKITPDDHDKPDSPPAPAAE